MESRHCGQDKRIFFCPVHNVSTPCSLQAFGIRCIQYIYIVVHCTCTVISDKKVNFKQSSNSGYNLRCKFEIAL